MIQLKIQCLLQIDWKLSQLRIYYVRLSRSACSQACQLIDQEKDEASSQLKMKEFWITPILLLATRHWNLECICLRWPRQLFDWKTYLRAQLSDVASNLPPSKIIQSCSHCAVPALVVPSNDNLENRSPNIMNLFHLKYKSKNQRFRSSPLLVRH